MSSLQLRIENIKILNEIKEALRKGENLSRTQRNELLYLLTNIPEVKDLLSCRTSPEAMFETSVLNISSAVLHLEKWINYFYSLPSSSAFLVKKEDVDLIKKGVIIKAIFPPSFLYNEFGKFIEVHLKQDGKAVFHFSSFEDAEQFPNLYRFKGTWKEAFLLIVLTIKSNWPTEYLSSELVFS